MPRVIYPLHGGRRPQFLLGMASLAERDCWSAGRDRRRRGARRRPTPRCSGCFTDFWLSAPAFLALAVLFVVLAVQSRIGVVNAAVLAARGPALPAPRLAADRPLADRRRPRRSLWSLRIFLLWSCAESLLRSTAVDFTTSLDALRAGRIGPRGGRALVIGFGAGAGPRRPPPRPARGGGGPPRHLARRRQRPAPPVRALPQPGRGRHLARRRRRPGARARHAAAADPLGAGGGGAGRRPLPPPGADRAGPDRRAGRQRRLRRPAGLDLPAPRPDGAADGLAALPPPPRRRLRLPLSGLDARQLRRARPASPRRRPCSGCWGCRARPAPRCSGWRPPVFVRRLEEERRFRNEMELLAKMQRGLLPRTLPGARRATSWRPTRRSPTRRAATSTTC